MPKDKNSGKKLADMMYGGDQMRATPQSRITGPVANALRKAQQFASQYEVSPRIPLLGGTGVDELLSLPEAASLMEDISYNGPGALIRGGNVATGGIGTFRPDPRIANLADFAGTATGVGSLATKGATKGALAAGRAGARLADRAVPQIMERGGAGADILSGLAQGSQSRVIKPKGGNWLNSGSVERSLEGLKRRVASENLANYTPEQAERLAASGRLEKNDALNKWVDRNLTNYIKKEMATPEDPVRRLAEEGVIHISPEQVGINRYKAPKVRAVEGGEALGVSDAARAWEDATDVAISPIEIKSLHRDYREPWMENASPSTRVYEPTGSFDTRALGFDHIIDVLREDLTSGRIRPEQLSKVSMEQAVRRTYEYDQEMAKKMREAQIKATEGMPVYKEYPEGYKWIELTTPEPKLGEGYRVIKDEPSPSNWKVVPHPEGDGYALRADNGQYAFGNQSYVERKWNTPDEARAEIPNYAEIQEPYPDEVYKILDPSGNIVSKAETEQKALNQLNRDEREKVLADALKYEGNTMGHCVGGYCPDVLEGRSRIYSLRDAKGEPHVTVEVNPSSQRVAPRHEEVLEEMKTSGLDTSKLDESAYDAAYEQALQRVKQNRPPEIVQIKGKQNRAPKEEYLPFVQDFVRSGQWSSVGDIQNTGLIRKSDLIDKFSPDELDAVGVGEYLTKGEQDDLLLKALNARNPGLTDELGLTSPPAEGMARGGRVHISDNPDVMQLELAKGGAIRMQAGGVPGLVGRGIKAVAKAVKPEKEAAVPLTLPRVRPTTKDILEAAERVGKQQAGEFVKSPLTTKTSNIAGRSKKEVDRLKEMEYKLTPIKDLPEMKPYEAQIGEVNIALPGDQTVSDMLLESVDGIPIGTTSEGGALFGRGRLSDPEDKRAFWASNFGPADLFQKKVTELAQLYDTDMVTAYHLAMGQMSNNFAQHMADANLRAIDYSKLNKDKMNAFDRVMFKGYVDPTTKERVTFENWPGIASPEDALLAMKEDPKLRKWFNNRMKTEKVTKPLDLPNAKSIEWAMTEPELRNMEINLTGLSAGRMKPGAELIPDSAHQTYSHDIPGTALGRAPELSPFSISFPDATAFVREKYRPQDFTGTIQKVFPHQVVDEAYLEDMYKYYTQLRKVRGFKEGGTVHKAVGGDIHGLSTTDLIYLQSQEDLGKLPPHAQNEAIANMGRQEVRQRMSGKHATGGKVTTRGSQMFDENNEQSVQNPVHFTENPDAMRLALSKRN